MATRHARIKSLCSNSLAHSLTHAHTHTTKWIAVGVWWHHLRTDNTLPLSLISLPTPLSRSHQTENREWTWRGNFVLFHQLISRPGQTTMPHNVTHTHTPCNQSHSLTKTHMGWGWGADRKCMINKRANTRTHSLLCVLMSSSAASPHLGHETPPSPPPSPRVLVNYKINIK